MTLSLLISQRHLTMIIFTIQYAKVFLGLHWRSMRFSKAFYLLQWIKLYWILTNTQNLVYQFFRQNENKSCGTAVLGKWIILHHILNKWARAPREQYTLEGLAPKVSGFVMLWGAFCQHGLRQLIPLEGRFTTNQYEVLLTDHLNLLNIKQFYTDGSALF